MKKREQENCSMLWDSKEQLADSKFLMSIFFKNG